MSAFANIVRAVADRNFGGSNINQVAEPYITGYHYSKWIFSSNLKYDIMSGSNMGMNGENTIQNNMEDVFRGTCLAVTPPGGTINKTEIQGLGGTKWSVPTNIDYGTSLSCKFLEMTELPIFKMIHAWCNLIRSNKSGTTGLTGIDYNKSNYSAVMFYWTTKPDAQTVEFASCYSGVFPLKDPQDLFAGDLSSVDKLELDIEFNVDFIYNDNWVFNKCRTWASEIASSESMMREDFQLVEQKIYNDPGYN